MKTEVLKFVSKNSTTIIKWLAVGGVISTTYMGARATLKADKILQRKGRPTEFGEKFKATWKCYAPTAVVGLATIGCIFGIDRIHVQRTAALASLYTISSESLKEYKKKLKDVVGEKKAAEVHDKIMKDKVIKAEKENQIPIRTAHPNETKWLDSYSGRLFPSDMQKIRSAVNDVNDMVNRGEEVSLNEFYYAIGLSDTKGGKYVGWAFRNAINESRLDVKFTTEMGEDGVPIGVIDYEVYPLFEY